MIIFKILNNINGYPYYEPYPHHNEYYGGYGGYGYGYNRNCFSLDSFVKLSNGQYKQIGLIEIGDEILTIENDKLVSTEVVMILDKHKSKKALFYTFSTSCGNEISLTEYHLIPIRNLNKSLNYKFAKDIQMGDLLLNEQLKSCSVRNITNQIKKGYISPLTMKGTLLVNQILSSSFAHVQYHHLAQFSLFPVRFYYRFNKFFNLNDPFYVYQSEGFNSFIQVFFNLIHFYKPDLLFLS